ncbi:MAG: double zinc ribbon domain-containing protein, partial [Alphaproteobacteria bacterium]
MARTPEKLLDVLLPPHCLTCDAQVERQGSFCAACFSGLNLISAPFCARCGVPFAHEGEAERNTDGALLCALLSGLKGRLARTPEKLLDVLLPPHCLT